MVFRKDKARGSEADAMGYAGAEGGSAETVVGCWKGGGRGRDIFAEKSFQP